MNALTNHFGELENPYSSAITLIDLIVYFAIILNVARARKRYKVPPPEIDGPPVFQRIMRVQVNTHEQIVLHLPLLWLTTFSVGDGLAALIGCLWPAGRILYALGYSREATRRGPGFMIGMSANAILFAAALVGILKVLL